MPFLGRFPACLHLPRHFGATRLDVLRAKWLATSRASASQRHRLVVAGLWQVGRPISLSLSPLPLPQAKSDVDPGQNRVRI